MQANWKSLRPESSTWLKKAAFTAAGLAALYAGVAQPVRRMRLVAEMKATGLAGDSIRIERSGMAAAATDSLTPPAQEDSFSPAPPPAPSKAADDRKMFRTDEIDLSVEHPAECAGQIRALAERLGGYLETSQVGGGQDAPSASLTVRVPVEHFDEARTGIRKLGLRVDSERLDAQDVTRQYVDQDARLHNLKAEEAQYLAILKRASTVTDTLAVSEKLGEVRGAIEQQQAEFNALSRQVETVAITVSLTAPANTQVFGLHWRPLYQLKIAARDGLNGLGDYATAMVSVLFYFPAILLWMGTFLAGLAAGYRILRWAKRRWFTQPA